MYRDPVLNIPDLSELRRLAQLVLRDDRPCLNSNVLDIARALTETQVLSTVLIAQHLHAIVRPADPRMKFLAVVEMTRRIVEPLADRDAQHRQASRTYLASLDQIAQLQVPPAPLEPPELMRLAVAVVEDLAARLPDCQLTLIHGSLAHGQADCMSDVNADFFFRPHAAPRRDPPGS